VSLDLSAAFDTIDHVTLINRLRTSFGITNSVLSWLQSYLSNRTQSVRIGHHSSTPTRCTTGVPQGSVLGPLLFATYTSPIATITHSFLVCHQQYADDTQLFIALNPSDLSSDIANFTTCLHALQSWFCLNGMALNPDKSDAIPLGTRQRSRIFASVRSVDVADCSVLLSDNIHVKILGVTPDCHLSLDKHISSICKSAYYHIQSLRHIRSAITDDMAKSVASSLVCSRLDYANSLFSAPLREISTVFNASKAHLLESLPVTVSLVVLTYLIFSRIYIGSQLINALNSNLPHWRTTFSTPLNLLIYVLCSIITLPFVLCVLPTPIFWRFHVSAQPLPPAVLALQPPQFGTHYPLASVVLPLQTLSVASLKLAAFSRPTVPPSGLAKCLRFGH